MHSHPSVFPDLGFGPPMPFAVPRKTLHVCFGAWRWPLTPEQGLGGTDCRTPLKVGASTEFHALLPYSNLDSNVSPSLANDVGSECLNGLSRWGRLSVPRDRFRQ